MLLSNLMGNKSTKQIYEKFLTAFKDNKTLVDNLPLSSISETKMLNYLIKLVNEKISEADIKQFENDLKLNIPMEESKEDATGKEKKLNEARQHSLLVAGHEEQPEILASFQSMNLEDAYAPKLDTVKGYSHQRVTEFLVSLLIHIKKPGAQSESKSFYQKIAQYFSDHSDESSEGTGISMALQVAALLVNSK